MYRTWLRAVGALVLLLSLLVAMPAAANAAKKPSLTPTVTKVSSNSGTTSGGRTVTVYGKNFAHVIWVRFGTRNGKSIRIQSTTKLTVVSPRQSARTVDIRVRTTKGISRIVRADRYRYVSPPSITSVSAHSGTSLGGTKVVISGRNFAYLSRVYFGTTRARITSHSTTRVYVVTPARSAGTTDIRVSSTYGTSSIGNADRFTYVSVPVASTAPVPSDAAVNPKVEINAVDCTSSTACVAVGNYTGKDGIVHALTLNKSGTTWKAARGLLPSTYSTTLRADLIDVSCSSSTFCVAVGSFKNASGQYLTLIDTYDNYNGWTSRTVDYPSASSATESVPLRAVSCSSDRKCTAVGDYVAASSVQGLVVTGDPTNWSSTDVSPSDATGPVVLNDVACTGNSSCVAVGSYYYASSSNQRGLIAALTSGSPMKTTIVSSALRSVACSSAGNCLAGGGTDSTSGASLRLFQMTKGGSWKATPAIAKGPNPSLNAIACSTASDCSAVGDTGATGLLARLSGTKLTVVTAPASAVEMTDIACARSTACAAIGQYDVTQKPTLAALSSGGTWSGQASPLPSGATTAALNSIDLNSTTTAIAVGDYVDSSGHQRGVIVYNIPT